MDMFFFVKILYKVLQLFRNLHFPKQLTTSEMRTPPSIMIITHRESYIPALLQTCPLPHMSGLSLPVNHPNRKWVLQIWLATAVGKINHIKAADAINKISDLLHSTCTSLQLAFTSTRRDKVPYPLGHSGLESQNQRTGSLVKRCALDQILSKEGWWNACQS